MLLSQGTNNIFIVIILNNLFLTHLQALKLSYGLSGCRFSGSNTVIGVSALCAALRVHERSKADQSAMTFVLVQPIHSVQFLQLASLTHWFLLICSCHAD